MPIPRSLSLSLSLSLGVLVACGEPQKPDPSASGTGESTGASSSTTTTAGTSGEATSSGGTSVAASSSGGAATDATTGAIACELVALTNEQADLLGPAKDCGVVDPWNHTLADWQAAVDCALAASAAEQPFKLVAWRQGIDSQVGTGYFGVAAESYARGTIDYDSFNPSALLRWCTALVATGDCIVAPGEPCLTCEGAGQGGELCE